MTNFDPDRPPEPSRPPAAEIASEVGSRLKRMAGSRPFLAYLGAVTVLTFLYYAFIATPLYVSESSFSIRGRSSSASSASGLLAGLTGGGASGGAMASISEPAEITDYINSPHMLAQVDKIHGLRATFCKPRLDIINWMPCDASQEDFLKFYRKMVIPRIDRESFIIRLEVRSVDAKSAHDISETVLKIAADYVDGLSGKIREDTLRTALREVQKAEGDVRSTRLSMTQYRAASGIVDPTQTASAQQAEINTILNSLNAARAERAALGSYSTASNPLAVQADARIATLERQLAGAKGTLASTSHDNTVAQKLYGYEGLMLANEYATKRLESARTNFDSARILAGQRERFLVRAVNPNYPDSPTLPKRILRFFEVIAVSVAVYAIVALAIAGVRDHQGV